ncbi:MAG TPA: right-handed parallel beta-helix repeat-containing protein [Armatimonadota bacterium]|nr:right-handed parallel beta-helix repeat-containing protein [Armatimonadota bacterium]HQK91953.1 right-handed parallel beta-helix repeat-containing protein [Armatimonadota bacterium]
MLALTVALAPMCVFAAVDEIPVERLAEIEPGAQVQGRLVIREGNVVIDGRGATLIGPGEDGSPDSLAEAGIGIEANGVSNVVLRNLNVHGFATGLQAHDCANWAIEGCDFSDNYHNPQFGWGEMPDRGGIALVQCRNFVLRGNRANRVWNGLSLTRCSDCVVDANDFSHCSNVCAKLWESSRNAFTDNNLSYGIRIDREAGEVHARDSTCVLIESGSNDNTFTRNDIRYGGDGVFVRVLNGWVSSGNVFTENDMSYANNNCVESWSPGNTYIRNIANHGSYGFWLGGSDRTVLIDNVAAYNGLPDGNHNAPEPGFEHGGIVIVSGSSSHTVLDGNHCHHNNGAGIVFRGDVGSEGRAWRTYHWVIRRNRLHDNRFGIWGQWGDWITLAANVFEDNGTDVVIQDTTRLVELPAGPKALRPPRAVLRGPGPVARVGRPVTFDASASRDPDGRKLEFDWDIGDVRAQGPKVTHVFDRPGFYRVGVTVSNGTLADLAYADLVVGETGVTEIGTEGQAERWGFAFEIDGEGRGRMEFGDDADAVCGRRSLRLRADPYPGGDATAFFPATRDLGLDIAGRSRLVLWVRAENPNIPGFQDAGPVVALEGPEGVVVYSPDHGRNLLSSPPDSEARWMWQRLSIPLDGGEGWVRSEGGPQSLSRVGAVSLTLDSWGGEPFTVWVDGLHFE